MLGLRAVVCGLLLGCCGSAVAQVGARGVSNEVCTSALMIEIGEEVNASSVGSSADTPHEGFCGVALPTERADIWFALVGDGTRMTVTTCTPQTDFDTLLHVYCGGCTNLVCIGGNDDGVPIGVPDPDCDVGASTVSFCSESGSTYLIRVSGVDGVSGAFELLTSSGPEPCVGALECNPSGACCLGPPCNACSVVTLDVCTTTLQGTFMGSGTDCGACDPPIEGACCRADGTCVVTCPSNCETPFTPGDTYQGDGTDCGMQMGFGGKQANGEWTLIVRDLATLDVGTIDGFGVRINGGAISGQSTSGVIPIPDADSDGATDSVMITDSGIIHDIEVRVGLTHTWVGDLVVRVRGPDGTELNLVSRPRSEFDNTAGDPTDFGGVYTFSDDATQTIPEQAELLGSTDVIPSGLYRATEPDDVTLVVLAAYVPSGCVPPPLSCDMDGDGCVEIVDLIGFLGLWFDGDPASDFNQNGVFTGNGGGNIADLIAFLACYFARSQDPC